MEELDFSAELDVFEDSICNVENAIFGGAFDESNIEGHMRAIAAKEHIDQRRQSYSTVSLAEKKLDYHKTFDEMSKIVTPVKEALKMFEEIIPENKRIQQLLEKYTKCDEKINNLRTIVDDFEWS